MTMPMQTTWSRARTRVAACGNDELSKGGKGESSGSTRVERGGDASPHAIGVRLNSVRSNVGEHVGVQVNEAGRDDLAGGIDHLARLPGGNVAFQARDFAVANGHVADFLKILRRVENLAAFDEEIE